MKKVRIDQLLASRDLAADSKEAAAFVMAGLVFSGQRRLEKPGELVPENFVLSVRSKQHPYVSRGGLKLAAALKHWNLEVKGLRCADFGASTGGFSDCLLQSGAAKIYAIDSGTNQLDWKLRKDPRIQVMENTNARNVTAEDLEGPIDFAAVDLSFIGLEKVFPALFNVLKPGANWVSLVKPQFEAAREEVPAGGVIVDAAIHQRVCASVHIAAMDLGLGPKEFLNSPIQGRDGNLEFLLMGQRR